MGGTLCAEWRPLVFGARIDGRFRPWSTDRGPAGVADNASAAVFVPTRAMIAANCAAGGCYDGSAISLSSAAVGATLGRLWSGLPPFGWAEASERSRRLSPVSRNGRRIASPPSAFHGAKRCSHRSDGHSCLRRVWSCYTEPHAVGARNECFEPQLPAFSHSRWQRLCSRIGSMQTSGVATMLTC